MFRNCLLLALVLAVVGASTTGTGTVTNKKPTAKSTLEVRKSMEKAFHTAPKAKIAEKKAAVKNLDTTKLEKTKTAVAAAPVAATPSASLRGAAIAMMEEVTQQKVTNKAKLFSPNKGFLEFITFQADTNCTVPTFVSGSAVNFCHYDPETDGAYADVVTFLKMPPSAPWYYEREYYTTTHLNFTDPHCTVANTTASEVSFPAARSNPWCSFYNFKEDHVFEPTPVNIPGSFVFREYETEGGCANEDLKELVSYSSMTTEIFGCQEYVNVDEYFKLVCVNGVPKAQVFPDAFCSKLLIRVDDLSNTCGDQNSAYPFSFKCAPPAQPLLPVP